MQEEMEVEEEIDGEHISYCIIRYTGEWTTIVKKCTMFMHVYIS